MFSTLHNGSPIYLLDKAAMKIRVAQVQSVTLPKPIIGQSYAMNTSVVDLIVTSDGETINLQSVPSALSVANQNNVIISETREGMTGEIENMRRISQQVIDNVDFHRENIERCDALLRELNPQLAKEQQQEEKIAQLETSLAEMKEMLARALNTKSKEK